MVTVILTTVAVIGWTIVSMVTAGKASALCFKSGPSLLFLTIAPFLNKINKLSKIKEEFLSTDFSSRHFFHSLDGHSTGGKLVENVISVSVHLGERVLRVPQLLVHHFGNSQRPV